MQQQDVQTWIRFFKEASIQAQFAQIYANKFLENRIRFDMLVDLDKPLLNEMGITAIGDCISILKYAKTFKIDDTSKEATNVTSDSLSNTKRKSDVAKRILDHYLSDTDTKPMVNEKISSSSGSTLSADLISRLNFNPNLSSTTMPITKVTFNEDSLKQSAKIIVSSTTDDDNFENLSKKKSRFKRGLDAEPSSSDTAEPLEYRGLLKHPDNEALFNQTTKRTMSLNERIKLGKPVKARLSQITVESSISTSANKFLDNIKIETNNAGQREINQNKTKLSSLNSDNLNSSSLLSRIKPNGIIKEKSILQIQKTIISNGQETITNAKNKLTQQSPQKKFKINPIIMETTSKSQATVISLKPSTTKQAIDRTNKPVFSRISF